LSNVGRVAVKDFFKLLSFFTFILLKPANDFRKIKVSKNSAL